jgi:hydroxypyruvate isomerase
MPRFSANLGFLFAERPLFARLGAAAAAGFKAVEVQQPYELAPRDVRAEIARHGLTVLGLNTPMGRPGEFGIGAVPGREREFAAAFKQALDYVTAIGGTAIHCMPGVVSPELRPAAERTFIENLKPAAQAAAEKRITLLLEPINHRDRPDYFLSRVEHAADLIARIGAGNIKIQFDCYHTQIMQGDLITRLERHLSLIGHVQVAGVPARGEPDQGEVNYPAIFAALDDMGYTGWIGAEYRPRGRTEDTLGWARAYGVVPRTH